MSAEPDFIRQTVIADDEAKCVWFQERGLEFTVQGAVWHRASYHPDNFDLILYEGWKEKPADEGAPRFRPMLVQ